MTNAELIVTIRNEIERLEIYYTSVEWYVEALLSFLSTLESEKPMNQDDELNDEIKRFVAEYGYERGNDILLIAIVARHFAKWGAEHASDSSEIPNDLEKMEREEELKKAVHQVSEEIVKEIFPDDLENGDFFTEIDLKNCITRVAYQFADWGAEHLKR